MSFDGTALLHRLSVIIVSKDISSMQAWIIRHLSTNCMTEVKVVDVGHRSSFV